MSSGIQHLPTGVLTYLIICALLALRATFPALFWGGPGASLEEAGKWAKEKGKSGGRSGVWGGMVGGRGRGRKERGWEKGKREEGRGRGGRRGEERGKGRKGEGRREERWGRGGDGGLGGGVGRRRRGVLGRKGGAVQAKETEMLYLVCVEGRESFKFKEGRTSLQIRKATRESLKEWIQLGGAEDVGVSSCEDAYFRALREKDSASHLHA